MRQSTGIFPVRAVADTTRMERTPSPSGSVWRKRVHLVGPPESGQVTSVVRYEPHSRFPEHDHPDGEEILVLEGVLSDEHGDWRAGTFLQSGRLSPYPFFEPWLFLVVKLRQFPWLGTASHSRRYPQARLGAELNSGCSLPDALRAGRFFGSDAPRTLGASSRSGSHLL